MNPEDKTIDPATQLSPRELHVFAQCIWWVADHSPPENDHARSMKWQDESSEWVGMAAEILRHLHRNGFKVQGPENSPAEPS